MKNKIILAVVAVVLIVVVIVSVKYLPIWSTFISVLAFVAGVFGGWFAKKVYDEHFKKN